ncbi:protein Niban 1-like [Odontesthes bonariensis]|uniref:protein Niban 1-like n=1 Tax=Odontesthes bonariensis TaxID=219752 RepID=UPI003F587948
MGASSSGLLDEAKVSHIKGLVDGAFESFSVFYRQQYSVAYLGHLHQEVEPIKGGKGLLLKHRPHNNPEEVLYQGSAKFSCWDEQGKKCRERYVVLRSDYKVEIHDNEENFGRGCAAKLVLQPAGGIVFMTDEESRAQLEKSCDGILNGVKEKSSSVVSSPDVFAVFLHLPYTGHTSFLFQQEKERDHFLSALKTCIRHRNLDPWHDASHESQAYARALRLYCQDKGCYESWEKLLGTEEQVLASQVMEEVLPWLQSQLQSKVKGKKTERIRQWLTTVQATYTLVLEQLSAALEALREECRQTASASQALIRSNLDQIMSSHSFLEQKVRACICEEAEKVCSESVAPYMCSILEALTENIGAGILGMQHTLHTQMDSAFSLTDGRTEETKKVLSSLRSVSLDQSYKKVENLREKFKDLKQRFGLSSAQRLVHVAHLEMERLLDSAVYTLEQFLQSSTRLQPSQVPLKMERAKERVLKQLDYDSRVVQKRLYQEALLEITLPSLTRKMDSKWKTEFQKFEEFIFSDYSSFILVQNVYDDVLRNILSKEIETVVQDAASKKSNNLLLDTSDLAISQYSLIGQTPPLSAPASPANDARRSSSTGRSDDQETAPVVEDRSQTADVCPQNNTEPKADTKSDPSISETSEQGTALLSPVIVVTQEFHDNASEEAFHFKETKEEDTIGSDTPITTDSTAAETSSSDAAGAHKVDTPDPLADLESTIQDSPELSPLVPVLLTDVQTEHTENDHSATPDLSTSDQTSEEASSIQPPSPSHSTGTSEMDDPMKISLGSLSEAIAPCSMEPAMKTAVQQPTDRAVYLTGTIKDNWEVERAKQEKQKEVAEQDANKSNIEGGDEEREEEHVKDSTETGGETVCEGCRLSAPPAESAIVSTTEQGESEEKLEDNTGGELKGETPTDDGEKAAEEKEADDRDCEEEKEKREKEAEVLQSPQAVESQPESAAELPLDSVAIIRELVTEITEVETVLASCPSSNSGAP